MKTVIYGMKFGFGFLVGQQVARIGFLAILRGMMGKEAFYKWIDEKTSKPKAD